MTYTMKKARAACRRAEGELVPVKFDDDGEPIAFITVLRRSFRDWAREKLSGEAIKGRKLERIVRG